MLQIKQKLVMLKMQSKEIQIVLFDNGITSLFGAALSEFVVMTWSSTKQLDYTDAFARVKSLRYCEFDSMSGICRTLRSTGARFAK